MHMTEDKQTEQSEVDPFIETEKRLQQLEEQVSKLNKALTEKDKMINTVVKTNKQLLTELNNVQTVKTEKVIPNKEAVMEKAFFDALKIKQVK